MTKRNIQNTVILGDVLKRYQVDNELSFYNDDQIFEIFAIQQITKGSNLSFLEVEDGVVDGASDGGIDSFLVLINDIAIATIEELEDISFISEKTSILSASVPVIKFKANPKIPFKNFETFKGNPFKVDIIIENKVCQQAVIKHCADNAKFERYNI